MLEMEKSFNIIYVYTNFIFLIKMFNSLSEEEEKNIVVLQRRNLKQIQINSFKIAYSQSKYSCLSK